VTSFQRVRGAAVAFAALMCVTAGVSIAPLRAQQEEPSKTLMPGKGAALTMAKCSICHDITHVTRSRLSRDEWEDNIKVMIARGMPAQPEEDRQILEYLATYYNRDKPPPAADPAAAAAGAAPAPERLLAERGCIACHALDKRVIGPSYREVAQKYRGDAAATTRLVAKVKEGGAGAWGQVPMPPHPQVPDAELKQLVGWILQQN